MPKFNLQNISLGKWNFWMGVFHLIQSILMFFLTENRTFEYFFNLPSFDQETRSLTLSAQKALELNLGYLIASFLLLSALAHFITIIPTVYKWYQSNLKLEMNLIRWWEYALSSSVMVVVIASLNGINDLSIIILIFSLNAMMNLFGAVMEKHNSALKQLAKISKKSIPTDWTSYIYGTIAGIIPWIIMGLYFYTAIDRASDQVPTFVYYIFPTLFVFFFGFALNMYLQYKKVGPWKNYEFGEKVYIILSLAAKSTLAWIIWGGTSR